MKKVYAPKGAAIKFANQIAKTNLDHCILWPFCKTGDGYGAVYFNKKVFGAHRYMLKISAGDPPKDKTFALHSCRNITCINPKHLRWGSNQDNVNDRIKDGTNAIGEKNPKAKLSKDDIINIRKDIREQKHIAAQYGVDQTTISNIKIGRTWKHIN